MCVENLPSAVDNAYTMRMARLVLFLVAALCLAADCPARRLLSFLVGRWSGAASALRPGGMMDLIQTEEAQLKLDGLVMMIEGVGRAKTDGKLVLQALGLISFDDLSGTYRMRAFNDGRWLETDVELAGGGNGLSWGFTLGDIKTRSILRINDKGEWTESAEVTVGTSPPRKLMDLAVRRIAAQ
jgi:hypothetical protein